MTSSFPLALCIAALAALLAAALADIRTRRIPNGLVLVVLTFAMALQLATGDALLWLSLLIAAAVFVAGAVLTRHGMIGGGDAKMIAAVTVLVPPALVPTLLLFIALAGGVLGCVYVSAAWLARRSPSLLPVPVHAGHFDRLIHREVARLRASEPMPYGVAIFAGTTILLVMGIFACMSATSCSL